MLHLHKKSPLLALVLVTACGSEPSTSTDGTTDVTTAGTEQTTAGETTESGGETSETDGSTEAPTTDGPTTDGPTTEDPTTEDPTTEDPTTEDPTTEDPTTDATEDPTTEDPTEGGEVLPPTNSDELLVWLQNGEYEWWPSDSLHDSNGPHFGQVQTFFNPALHDSFEADEPMHPAGAATVKRLYGNGNATGWAVMVKIQDDSDNGNGWYWYEYYNGSTYADGTGVGLCTNCHSGGKDYVLTPFPLQ